MNQQRHRPLRIARLTMIEMFVALGVLAVLFSFLMGLIVKVHQINNLQRGQSELYEQQRLLFDIITRDLRCMVVSNTAGREISYGFASGTDRYFFVTASAIGVQNADTETLMEVAYCWGSDSLSRWYTGASSASYNFLGNTMSTGDTPAWASENSWQDKTAILASSVDSFSMIAYSSSGGLVSGSPVQATDTMVKPQYIVVEAQLSDPRKRSKVFRKIIYLQRED